MIGGLPDLFSEYVSNAKSVYQIDLDNPSGTCFFSVSQPGMDWPGFVLALGYSPAGYGFSPGVLLVPETGILYVGAGETLLAFDLNTGKKLWEDFANCGFWRWRRYGDFVLMSSELELSAWDIKGRKLWTKSVEPPWNYAVSGEQIDLDVMGDLSQFDIKSGL